MLNLDYEKSRPIVREARRIWEIQRRFARGRHSLEGAVPLMKILALCAIPLLALFSTNTLINVFSGKSPLTTHLLDVEIALAEIIAVVALFCFVLPRQNFASEQLQQSCCELAMYALLGAAFGIALPLIKKVSPLTIALAWALNLPLFCLHLFVLSKNVKRILRGEKIWETATRVQAFVFFLLFLIGFLALTSSAPHKDNVAIYAFAAALAAFIDIAPGQLGIRLLGDWYFLKYQKDYRRDDLIADDKWYTGYGKWKHRKQLKQK